MRNAVFPAIVLSVLMLVIPAFPGFVPMTHASTMSELSYWQLREGRWYELYPPDENFSTPEPSILRAESTTEGAGGGYVFAVFNRMDLDGKRLQVRWNVYHSYPDERDLNLSVLYVFDEPFDRTDMSNYFKENSVFEPGHWNVDCSYFKAIKYPGPLGAPAGWLGWRTDTSDTLNLSSWASDTVTVLLGVWDAWIMDSTRCDFDWLKVLDANDNEVYDYQFDGTILMEETGTYHDYGIIVPPGEPIPTIPTLLVEPSSYNTIITQPGFCFTAGIKVTNVTNLYGYGLELSFDPALLMLSDIQLDLPPEWGSDYFIVRNETNIGANLEIYLLAVTALYPAPAFNGNMRLATLSFNVTNSEFVRMSGRTVVSTLNLYQTTLVDDQGNVIPHATYGAQVTLSFPLVGDINGDGVVNIIDVVRVAIAFGSQSGDPNWNAVSDVNSDGTVDIIDLVIVAANYGRTTN